MNVSHYLSSPWPGHDSSVGEWMYLTICPLYDLGHDSSVGEWKWLAVCSLYDLGHDSSVGEWKWLAVCSLGRPGSIPGRTGVFQGIFPWLITLCQPVLRQRDRKQLNLPSMAPHNLWKLRRKAEVQLWIDNGWGKKKACLISGPQRIVHCVELDTIWDGLIAQWLESERSWVQSFGHGGRACYEYELENPWLPSS